jgi:hypothetical protein
MSRFDGATFTFPLHPLQSVVCQQSAFRQKSRKAAMSAFKPRPNPTITLSYTALPAYTAATPNAATGSFTRQIFRQV